MLIKFSQIIPPKADDPTDSRRSNKRAGVKELAASIAAHGLLQPLALHENGKRFQVVDGRRRWHALKALIDDKVLGKTHEVEAILVDPSLENSLAANIVREPLHPVDEYEDFAALIEGGEKPADIAKRFGLSKRHVEQRLALGRLNDRVREAWREGRIDADIAKAMTLGSPEDQLKVLASLSEVSIQNPQRVRELLLGYTNEDDARASLKFVGRAAYEKAGGGIAADLFGDADLPLDLTLLRKLADDKLTKLCEEAENDGCPFALVERDIPPSERSLYTDAPPNSTKAGVIIGIGPDGKPTTRRVIRATIAEVPPKPPRKEKQGKDTPAGFSAKVAEIFDRIVEHTVRDCIEDSPDLAETILCAALVSNASAAIDFRRRTVSPVAPTVLLADNLEAVSSMDVPHREQLFMSCVAQCIDFAGDRAAAAAILETIPPEDFEKAYRIRLKDEAALDSLSRRDAIAIIRSIDPEGGDPGAMSDEDLKLEAARAIREAAWKPPQ